MVISCHVTALSRDERERHHRLVRRLVTSRTDQRELEDGFVLTIGPGLTADEIQEWIALEMRRCPFVTFTFQPVREELSVVRLTGPKGVKPFLDASLVLS